METTGAVVWMACSASFYLRLCRYTIRPTFGVIAAVAEAGSVS